MNIVRVTTVIRRRARIAIGRGHVSSTFTQGQNQLHFLPHCLPPPHTVLFEETPFRARSYITLIQPVRFFARIGGRGRRGALFLLFAVAPSFAKECGRRRRDLALVAVLLSP